MPGIRTTLLLLALFCTCTSGTQLMAQTTPRPQFAPLNSQNIAAGSLFELIVSARLPDNRVPALLMDTALPASFVDNGDGTRTFRLKTTAAMYGTHQILFVAYDEATPSAVSTETLTLTIRPVDNTSAPLLDEPVRIARNQVFIEPLVNRFVAVNELLKMRVIPYSLTRNVPDLAIDALPENATFNDNLDGTRTLYWRPEPGQGGIYRLTFTATDAADNHIETSQTVKITVIDPYQSISRLADLADEVYPVQAQTPDKPADPTLPHEPLFLEDPAQISSSPTPIIELSANGLLDDWQAPAALTAEQFVERLTGTWLSDCHALETGYARTMLAFVDGVLVADQYRYDSPTCEDAPHGVNFPLWVMHYEFQDKVASPTQPGSRLFSLMIEQVGSSFIPGIPVTGTEDQFGIVVPGESGSMQITLLDSGFTLSASHPQPGADTAAETSLRFKERRKPLSASVSAESLLGVWRSDCLNNITSQFSFSETLMQLRVENWDDIHCSGQLNTVQLTDYAVTFGKVERGLFGDSLIPLDRQFMQKRTLDSNSHLIGQISADEQESDNHRYESLGILDLGLDKDTLIFGYCMRPENCETTLATRPMMLDLNYPRRWRRIDSR